MLASAKQVGYDPTGSSFSPGASRTHPPAILHESNAIGSQSLGGAAFGATPKIKFPENSGIPYFSAVFAGIFDGRMHQFHGYRVHQSRFLGHSRTSINRK
jgi:hypothetical protein